DRSERSLMAAPRPVNSPLGPPFESVNDKISKKRQIFGQDVGQCGKSTEFSAFQQKGRGRISISRALSKASRPRPTTESRHANGGYYPELSDVYVWIQGESPP
ncbi:hypothetical protein, partial [Sphingobium sp.]|uniref:hypothetical protein n=1 Tax=Sphingobium sp. TaxID=1912891 RepID=UPI002D7FB177